MKKTVIGFLVLMFVVSIGICLFFSLSGYNFIIIADNNINPSMPKGSLIFFEVPREEIQSGQVIAFNNKIYDQNGKEDIETVFYRVVSQEGDRFITKEDINQDVVYVSRGDVVGVYLFNIPSYVIWPSLGGVLVLFIGLFGLLVLFKLRRKEEK